MHTRFCYASKRGFVPSALRGVMLFFVLLWATGTQTGVTQVPGVPSPEEFHGYELGTNYTITAALYDYYRELARQSPRVEYSEYGRSIQGRPLPMVMVSSEANLARKEEIRERMLRLTNVTDPLPEGELAQLLAGTPSIVWAYIIDVDEEAGIEVLQEMAYELATREDADAQGIRDSVLVILTPLANPDAHARYVTWHKLYDVDGASVDPLAVENRAHWGMNTDGNAYGIDVNRDFSWFVSPEMQALARAGVHWRPQFWLDVHSGPNVIFITPYPPPFHPLWPERGRKWWHAVAEQANENFGRRGWSFSAGEGYEGPGHIGFSDTWGMLGPAVTGFLYESFGGRPGKTEAFVRSDGTIATMRMAMDRHYLAIWSQWQVARDRREELLRDAHLRVVDAVREARSNPIRTVVIPGEGPGVDPDKLNRLIERLTLQGVEVRRATQPFAARSRDYFDMDNEVRREYPAGTYLVDFAQPQARLVRSLLDPTLDYEAHTVVKVPFTARYPYYGPTWAVLTYLFGVPAHAVGAAVAVESEVVTAGPRPVGMVDALSRAEPPYAYILEPRRESSYRIAIRLMREGYRLRVFHGAFRIGETQFPKGTIAAIRLRNPEGLGERLAELADEHGGRVIEVAGPYTDGGVTFGADQDLAAIPTPLVAVVADYPVAQDHVFGGIRNVLEADFGFAFTPVMLQTINNADLSKYTAVVLPHAGMSIRGGPGFSAGYKGILNVENLQQYVQGGGTLIAVKGAAEVIAQDPVLGRDVSFDGWADSTTGPTLRARWEVPQVPESGIVPWRPGLNEVGLPLLASGFEREEFAAPAAYPVLLQVREGGRAQVLARYSADAARLVLDGWSINLEKALGRPFVVVQRVGRQGKVIYFADSTTFRGNWYGLNLLFLNSLIFGPTL
jgi:hypothetical protein